MNKLYKPLTVLGVSVLAITACGNDAEEEETSENGQGSGETITVGVASLPIFAPVFVADDQGYFEDNNVDVELEFVQTGSDAVPLLSAGQLDVVAAGFAAGIFSGLESGLEFQVVGSMGVSDGSDYAPAHLVVRDELVASGDVESLEDLEGMSIGVAGGEGGTGAYLTALALSEAGLNLEDVELVNIGNPDMPAAVENGSLDAGLMSAPFSENAINEDIGESFWYPPEGTSGTGLMYGEHFADSQDAQPFFDALVRASQDLQGDARYTDEYLQIIADYTDQPIEGLQDVPLYTWESDLRPLPDQLTGMEQVWLDSGALNYDEPLGEDNYIDSSFADEAASE